VVDTILLIFFWEKHYNSTTFTPKMLIIYIINAGITYMSSDCE